LPEPILCLLLLCMCCGGTVKWLPWQYPFSDRKRCQIIVYDYFPTMWWNLVKISPISSEISLIGFISAWQVWQFPSKLVAMTSLEVRWSMIFAQRWWKFGENRFRRSRDNWSSRNHLKGKEITLQHNRGLDTFSAIFLASFIDLDKAAHGNTPNRNQLTEHTCIVLRPVSFAAASLPPTATNHVIVKSQPIGW